MAELVVGIELRGLLNHENNLDDIKEQGLYYVGDNVPNIPPNSWYGSPLLVLKTYGYSFVTQFYISAAYNKIYRRSFVYNENKWTEWLEM